MTYQLVTTFNNWDELYFEMKDLFLNDTRFYSYKPDVYNAMIKVVDEIKNNTQTYIDNPAEAHKFFEQDEKNTLMQWFPYISGHCAALLEMKFFDKHGTELKEEQISMLGGAMRDDNKEILNNTFIKVFANVATLEKLQEKPKPKNKI